MKFVHPDYLEVAEVFESLHQRSWEVGSSFTGYVDDQKVVELYGGSKDGNPDHAFTPEVLQLVASSTKFVASICVGLLVDRNLLQWKDKISSIWPEFGQNGKEHITVEQLMTHQAGLVALDQPFSDNNLSNPKTLSDFLARQKTNWDVPEMDFYEERSAPQAYHAITQGFYASELCSRVDPKQRTIGQFLKEEVCDQLGIEFYIGLPDSLEHRIGNSFSGNQAAIGAILEDKPLPESMNDERYQFSEEEKRFLKKIILQPDSLPARGLLKMIQFEGVSGFDLANDKRMRSYEFASSNGFTNATSLASLASLMATGGCFQGHKLFSNPQVISQMIETRNSYQNDLLMEYAVRFTRGFAALESKDETKTECYGWGGAGGSMVRFHPQLGFGCAYVPNASGLRMAFNDPRPNSLLSAFIRCVKKAKKL